MKLAELDQFLKDCIKAEISFPKEMMAVVVDDFYDAVPQEKQNFTDLEYRAHVEQEIAVVQIVPPTPSDAIRKAKSYDELENKIAKCYVDDNGDELSAEESEDIDLCTIGEIAASHFDWI